LDDLTVGISTRWFCSRYSAISFCIPHACTGCSIGNTVTCDACIMSLEPLIHALLIYNRETYSFIHLTTPAFSNNNAKVTPHIALWSATLTTYDFLGIPEHSPSKLLSEDMSIVHRHPCHVSFKSLVRLSLNTLTSLYKPIRLATKRVFFSKHFSRPWMQKYNDFSNTRRVYRSDGGSHENICFSSIVFDLILLLFLN